MLLILLSKCHKITHLMSAQVLETIACYPENMEAKELRRILTQPHFMVGSFSTTSTPNSQRDPCCVEWCVLLRPGVSDARALLTIHTKLLST